MLAAKCASNKAELYLCLEARSGRVPGAWLLLCARALPRLALLLGSLPWTKQAARVWEMPLAPFCLHLCSCLSFVLRFQESLGRALGLVGCPLPRAPAVRALSEGREGQLQDSSSGCVAGQTQRRTESTRLPGPLAGVFSPAHREADSVFAQKVYDRRRFPSTLLPSRDMCRWLGPDPACLGSRPQPQLRGSSP